MDIEQFVVRLLPVLSNLVFLFPAEQCLEWEWPVDVFLWSVVAVFASPAYHLCMGFYACLWNVSKHHVVDFWSAEMALPMVALYFIRIRAPYIRTWFILVSIIAIGLLVTGTDSSFMNQVVIGLVSGAIVVCYLLWHRYAHGYWPEYDMQRLVLGLGFLVLGVCFFVVQEWWPPYYGYLHAYWHASTAMGVGFMVGIQPKRTPEEREKCPPMASQIVGSTILLPMPRRSTRFTPSGQMLVHRV